MPMGHVARPQAPLLSAHIPSSSNRSPSHLAQRHAATGAVALGDRLNVMRRPGDHEQKPPFRMLGHRPVERPATVRISRRLPLAAPVTNGLMDNAHRFAARCRLVNSSTTAEGLDFIISSSFATLAHSSVSWVGLASGWTWFSQVGHFMGLPPVGLLGHAQPSLRPSANRLRC